MRNERIGKQEPGTKSSHCVINIRPVISSSRDSPWHLASSWLAETQFRLLEAGALRVSRPPTAIPCFDRERSELPGRISPCYPHSDCDRSCHLVPVDHSPEPIESVIHFQFTRGHVGQFGDNNGEIINFL